MKRHLSAFGLGPLCGRACRAAGAAVLALGVFAGAGAAQSTTPAAPATPVGPAQAPLAPGVPDDGWPDISEFLDTKFGFMPVGTVITEPAVGLGAAGGLAFISQPIGRGRPDIAMAGGFGTDNGSKGAVIGDSRYWFDGRVQTLAAVVWASVNLDFYGLGNDSALADQPLSYNLEPSGGLVQAKIRLGRTPIWAGLAYAFARTAAAFDAPEETPGIPDTARVSRIGGLGPSLTVDARDNMFTPTRGMYLDAMAGLFSESLGGDDTFQRLQVIGMYFQPLPGRVFTGARLQAATTSEDTPFYMRPFVLMRGVPAMRYQGETLAQIEGEVRWQFWKRLSLVAFGGAGAVWADVPLVPQPRWASAAGGGLRYELARRYGIHVGVDVAGGPDGPAFYIQFGSAWIRP